jgi:hypothetical protein
VALGGVACKLMNYFFFYERNQKKLSLFHVSGTLGGATLGSIALAGSPTSHLTAGLLMTGTKFFILNFFQAWKQNFFVHVKENLVIVPTFL